MGKLEFKYFSRPGSYYKNTVTTNLKNCNAEKCASDVKKMKNRCKQNFEGETNSMQLDKEDTQRSNQNSKCVFNILIPLLVFIMFNKLTNVLVKCDFILQFEA